MGRGNSLLALHKILSVDAQESQPRPQLDCAQLGLFARDAQLRGDYQLASQYYQEVHYHWPWHEHAANTLFKPIYHNTTWVHSPFCPSVNLPVYQWVFSAIVPHLNAMPHNL